ncbi:E3 ubiquitin-protein ligase FANCL [Onthophagus taurus]|uniref:E3 ubiquitin-protein ligase FANCL n=1 Tax=Onthophagus taurus TaxID=166361 RepID=UPI0039BDAA98
MTQRSDLDLLLKYPMVLPKNYSKYEYSGYIKVNENDYEVNFTIENKKYILKPTDDLNPFWNKIKKLSEIDYFSPVDFLDTLTECIKKNSKLEKPEDYVDLYRKVLREYSELRQFYINIDYAQLSKDLKTIRVVHSDEKSRKHPILIEVDYEAPPNKIFKITKCDLPEYQESLVKPPDGSLLTVYENYLKIVNNNNLQALFDILDEIDKNCWVLEPENPTRRDVSRRIMLDEKVSIVITFNPKDVSTIPQIKFLGPVGLTKKYVDLLNKNCVNYNPHGDTILELYNLLEIKNFPRQPTNVLEEELLVNDEECCICFSKWLEGKAPEVQCENGSCRQRFHFDCLYQWLRSSSSTTFYYEIYGNCPNCEKKIRCPFPAETNTEN